ncbi:MAG: sulfatase-like hydrolase/transferase [Flavobacteriales bacterium]|nr:sulfatase-like hydrolase/transferase [Flavobacteriales bacterium]
MNFSHKKFYRIPIIIYFIFYINLFLIHPLRAQLQAGKEKYLKQIPPAQANSPNIIFIVADDLGYYDLSVYGNTCIQTTNLDQLAYEGALFTGGYATAPICAPSRAGFLTGRYQQRFGFQFQPHQRYPKSKFEWWWFKNLINTNDLEPAPWGHFPPVHEWQNFGLPTTEITLSEILKSAGYATAWIGKWHLGYHEPMLPQNFGFEYTYGCYEAYTLFAEKNDKQVVYAPIHEFTDKHIWKNGRKGPCAIRKHGTIIQEKTYLTYAFGREAKFFIEKCGNKPFFLYLPITAPHTPYQAPKNIYDSLQHIPTHNKRVYYSMIVAMDQMIGDLVKYLKSVGKWENTLFIFTSDNGAALYSKTVNNFPLNGGKFTFYEGGIRVPLIIHYPPKIKPKTIIHEPVMLFDVFATILDLLHIPLPVDRKLDGMSLWPLLESNETKHHTYLYWYSGYNFAIRSGNWKLIVNQKDKTMELYSLLNDQGEKQSMHETKSQIAFELLAILNAWITEIPKPTWPQIMDYTVRINGKKCTWAI